MHRYFSLALAVVAAIAFSPLAMAQQQWETVKGQIVWEGDVPKQPSIAVTADKKVCDLDKEPLEEDYLVNPTNKGLKNVFVWIRPVGAAKDAPFPKELINPALAKPATDTVEIDQPCCRFIPHVLAARQGQTMVIKNSAPIAHNAKWSSGNNGDFNNQLIAGGSFTVPKPLVSEPREVTLQCNIHGWMKAHVRVFDHPYFAITDADGKFEIKDAPVGNFNLFVHHPANGWLNGAAGSKGKPINIAAAGTDVGVLKMKKNE
jgi:hypothetical protein